MVLDNTFDAYSIDTITKYIHDMLQIKSSTRPSASVLSKEFTRQCQLIHVNLLALSDDMEQTQSMQHLVALL